MQAPLKCLKDFLMSPSLMVCFLPEKKKSWMVSWKQHYANTSTEIFSDCLFMHLYKKEQQSKGGLPYLLLERWCWLTWLASNWSGLKGASKSGIYIPTKLFSAWDGVTSAGPSWVMTTHTLLGLKPLMQLEKPFTKWHCAKKRFTEWQYTGFGYYSHQDSWVCQEVIHFLKHRSRWFILLKKKSLKNSILTLSLFLESF